VPLLGPRKIGVGPKIGDLVFHLQFDALVDGAIVANAVSTCLPKLSVVKQVTGDLVIEVGATSRPGSTF
jgi:hypothetical protein